MKLVLAEVFYIFLGFFSFFPHPYGKSSRTAITQVTIILAKIINKCSRNSQKIFYRNTIIMKYFARILA